MKNRAYCIYSLSNPASGEVFYVGVTLNPYIRLRSHITGKNNRAKTEYIKNSCANPVMNILAEYEDKIRAYEVEGEYIHKYFNNGHPLLNARKTIEHESRKPITLMVRPTIKKKAQSKAEKEGTSLSNLVDTLLEEYIKIKP